MSAIHKYTKCILTRRFIWCYKRRQQHLAQQNSVIVKTTFYMWRQRRTSIVLSVLCSNYDKNITMQYIYMISRYCKYIKVFAYTLLYFFVHYFITRVTLLLNQLTYYTIFTREYTSSITILRPIALLLPYTLCTSFIKTGKVTSTWVYK